MKKPLPKLSHPNIVLMFVRPDLYLILYPLYLELTHL
jgi:hypothetical protein